jgi:hypothetical protein
LLRADDGNEGDEGNEGNEGFAEGGEGFAVTEYPEYEYEYAFAPGLGPSNDFFSLPFPSGESGGSGREASVPASPSAPTGPSPQRPSNGAVPGTGEALRPGQAPASPQNAVTKPRNAAGGGSPPAPPQGKNTSVFSPGAPPSLPEASGPGKWNVPIELILGGVAAAIMTVVGILAILLFVRSKQSSAGTAPHHGKTAVRRWCCCYMHKPSRIPSCTFFVIVV